MKRDTLGCAEINSSNSFVDILSETERQQSLVRGLFAAAIVKKRIQLCLTQRNFAEKFNVSQAMISKWESGEYNLTLDKMIEILNKLSVEYTISLGSETVGSAKKRDNFVRPKWSSVSAEGQISNLTNAV